MSNPVDRKAWVLPMLLAGIMYLLIGRAFAAPTTYVQAWRLAAWAGSFAVFAIHIWYEHFRLLNGSPRSIALHVAGGVAIGGAGLAVAGMIHSVAIGTGVKPLFVIALIAWPAITAIPGFCVALIIASVLSRARPSVSGA